MVLCLYTSIWAIWKVFRAVSNLVTCNRQHNDGSSKNGSAKIIYYIPLYDFCPSDNHVICRALGYLGSQKLSPLHPFQTPSSHRNCMTLTPLAYALFVYTNSLYKIPSTFRPKRTELG